IAVGPRPPPVALVPEQHHPAFTAGRDDLVLAEGERAGVPKGTDELAVDPRAKSRRAILENENVVAAGKLHEAGQVRRTPVEVDDDDRLGAAGYQPAHGGRRDRFRID